MALVNDVLIEKEISWKIREQFPAYFREIGPELVQLTTDYYKFLETETDMALYNSRRLYEYRDVGTTLDKLLIYFKETFLNQLPLKDDNDIRFLVRNIQDLYRRKGSEGGVKLFFRMFYEEDVALEYPGKYMLKPSASQWKIATFLQAFPTDGTFYNSKLDRTFTYSDLIGKNIMGNESEARAAVRSIQRIMINDTLTPIIYVDEVIGKFEKYDTILSVFDGVSVKFGQLNGVLDTVDVDVTAFRTTNNNVGDIMDVVADRGNSGKVIVTEVTDNFTGSINYDTNDGGWGYSIESTRLLVSEQLVFFNNANRVFDLLENVTDQFGNVAQVIGQNDLYAGFKFSSGTGFTNISRIVSTGPTPVTLVGPNVSAGAGEIQSTFITTKNSSSPGQQYADTLNNDHVKVTSLTDIESVSLLTDEIAPFLNTPLNATDYDAAPSTQAMSGSASPKTISTPLNQAFDLENFNIGTITSFDNVDPGQDYTNDVFAIARDSRTAPLERFNQILYLSSMNANFSIGTRVSQTGGPDGIIRAVGDDFIKVRPLSYAGFNRTGNIVLDGVQSPVVGVERDYSSLQAGLNAHIKTDVEFAVGKIEKASVINSGLGYIENDRAKLRDEFGEVHAEVIIGTAGQGINEGFWSSETSHLNGYRVKDVPREDKALLPTKFLSEELERVSNSLPTQTFQLDTWFNTIASDGFAYGDITKSGSIDAGDVAHYEAVRTGVATKAVLDRWNDIIVPSFRTQGFFDPSGNSLFKYVDTLEYYQSNQRVQDSDYYQDYSYVIKSRRNLETYEEPLKDVVHLAGVKIQDKFAWHAQTEGSTNGRMLIIRKDDYVPGGAPIVGPGAGGSGQLTVDTTSITADTTSITADNG